MTLIHILVLCQVALASECVDKMASIFKYMRRPQKISENSNLTYEELSKHMGLTSAKYVTDIGQQHNC